METDKSGLESVPVHVGSVAAQPGKRLDVQTPLTAVYIHTLPAYPQPAAAIYPKEPLPVLTLHIAGGLQSPPGLGLAPAAPPAKPKSAGKHVCPHCGRDCMKPSVLEKHLRCHTGERPYPCTTCGVSFKTQSNLYKHRRTQAHARLSSESEHSSVDSMSSSRETCSSSLSLDELRSDELGSIEKNATQSTTSASTKKTFAVQPQSSVNELKERSSLFLKTETISSGKVSMEEDKQMMERARPPLTVSRHLPLQRQEALLFSKQWESSVSRGKSQNHESTDSGFSESSDHYPSPSNALPEHSMEFLTESNQENPEASPSTHEPSEKSNSGKEPRHAVREQEQKLLEERISKLISENTAVVEDKQLENVRPRKTVLSKQGSIDLPMPYTYKDSFHFDMRNNPTQTMGSQRYKSGLYSSVPTQCSSTVEHAPLTRSSSLPFSVSLLQPDRSSSASSNQSDYVTLVRRGSSGQVNPSSFALRPVSQHSSTHRPLVRQSAVDCNHATEGLFTNPSVEEASRGSLSCDGDGGDICEEPNTRRVRRKKSQNVSYKWYMYRGGTFKRFYNEKNGERNTVQGRKCSINSEVAQGLQKATSVVHKETLTTTGSTINNTKSSGMVGRHSASFPSNSSVDLNLQSSHLDSSIKAPPRRNLSLSLLPLQSTVSCKPEGVNTTEAGRLIHFEKQCDCTSYLCGGHMPSDRKKQKTDNKVIPHMEMLADLNTVTHPPLSVTGTLPQLDTNLTFVKLQHNPEHTELRGALFLPSQLDANELSASSSQTTSTPSAAKNSFLPKYQLKLPNAPEPDSKDLQQVEDKPKGYDDCTPPTSLLSTPTDQTLPTKNFGNAISFSLMETCAKNKMSAVTSTQGQFVLSCTVPTLYQSGTSKLSQGLASNQGLVHRQFAAPTKTTSCLQDYQTGLCSTLIRPLKTSENAIPSQIPRPNACAAASESSTTANNQTSVTPSPSYLSLIPPLSHAQPSPASGWTNPGNGAPVGSNPPVVPCPVTPYGQPAPKVFHVHTADLQICLQIISDEQLALIAPQIERPLNTGPSQKCEIEGMSSKVVQKKSHSFVTRENSKEGGNDERPGNQNKTDEGRPSPELSTERITPSLSGQFVQSQPGPRPAQDRNTTPAAASDESNPPPGSSSHPHTDGHVNRVTQTRGAAGDVMSTEASLRSVNAEESQTSEVEQAFSWSCSADGQFFPDKRVSQDGKVSQNLSGQHKLSVSSLSTKKVNQDGLKSEQLAKESQPSLQTRTQAASCNAGTSKSRRLQSVEILSQGTSAACADESLSSFSINKYKASKKLNPQASTHCSHPEERTLSESQNPSIHPGIKCNRLGRLDKVSPSLETTTCKSQDVVNSGTPETHKNQSTSPVSDVQLERPKDGRTVCSTNQHPERGLPEGVSLAECGAHKDLHTLEHAGAAQPENTDRRPEPSQEEAGTHYQTLDEPRGWGLTEEVNRIKSSKGTEPLCRYTVTKLEGEDTNAQTDSFRYSSLSEQPLHYCSQAHSGLCECPSPPSKQTPISSNILSLPSSSICAGHPNSPLQEMNHLLNSQQNWRSSILSDQHTRVLHESSLNQHVIAHSHLSQTEHIFSRSEPCLQQTYSVSHEHQKILSANLSTQPENMNTAMGSSYTLTSGIHRNPRLSPDFITLSSTHQSSDPHFCRTTRLPSKNNQNTGSPLKSFTYLEAKEKQDSLEMKPNDHCQSSECGRADLTSKYQSILLAGSLSGYQPAECVAGGVRPVLSCYTEDTSSSDDEGKLIIEL